VLVNPARRGGTIPRHRDMPQPGAVLCCGPSWIGRGMRVVSANTAFGRSWPNRFMTFFRVRLSWRGKAGIAVTIFLLAYGWRQYRESVRIRAVAENTIRAQTLKREIDRRFPSGTLESEVLDFLRKEHPDFVTWPSGNRTEYGVPVAEEPSNVWYCGSFTAYVRLRCEDRRLVLTEITRWSNDCL
jgi:hypothetical protein